MKPRESKTSRLLWVGAMATLVGSASACSGEPPQERISRFPKGVHKQPQATAERAVDGGPGDAGDEVAAEPMDHTGPSADGSQVMVPRFSSDTFPCTDCHDPGDANDINKTRRELTDNHDKIVLKHGPVDGWCYQCHTPENRNVLHLASGTPVSFEESYRLCGQCHGEKLRDWKVGVHGKRTGYWNGPKEYLLCVHCHSPHQPHFAPVRPLPPPQEPSKLHE